MASCGSCTSLLLTSYRADCQKELLISSSFENDSESITRERARRVVPNRRWEFSSTRLSLSLSASIFKCYMKNISNYLQDKLRTTVPEISDNAVVQESLLRRCLPQDRWKMEISGSSARGLSSGPPWFWRSDILLGIGWKGACRSMQEHARTQG